MRIRRDIVYLRILCKENFQEERAQIDPTIMVENSENIVLCDCHGAAVNKLQWLPTSVTDGNLKKTKKIVNRISSLATSGAFEQFIAEWIVYPADSRSTQA